MLALDDQPTRRGDRFDSAPLSVLTGDMLEGRFRSWRGSSGRRYTFSVYDRDSCPAYEHAVMIVAAVLSDHGRRMIFIGDTGCFPEIALSEAAKPRPAEGAIEFHVHLLARSRAERIAVISDLAQPRRS